MKNKLLLFTIFTFLASACENWIIFEENKKPAQQIQKKNSIAELKPKHRFLMPLEDVKNEKKFKETAKSILKYELEDIVEVTKETFKKFPNPSEDKDFKLDYKMIMGDFPNLSKEELKANDSLIARYYAVNLDYEVLQILKKTKVPKKEKKDVKLKLNIKDLTRPPNGSPRRPSFFKRRKCWGGRIEKKRSSRKRKRKKKNTRRKSKKSRLSSMDRKQTL